MQEEEEYGSSPGKHTQPTWVGDTLHIKCWARFMSDVYI